MITGTKYISVNNIISKVYRDMGASDSLNISDASHSRVATNRVAICTPCAPNFIYLQISAPVNMPPAAMIGIFFLNSFS